MKTVTIIYVRLRDDRRRWREARRACRPDWCAACTWACGEAARLGRPSSCWARAADAASPRDICACGIWAWRWPLLALVFARVCRCWSSRSSCRRRAEWEWRWSRRDRSRRAHWRWARCDRRRAASRSGSPPPPSAPRARSRAPSSTCDSRRTWPAPSWSRANCQQKQQTHTHTIKIRSKLTGCKARRGDDVPVANVSVEVDGEWDLRVVGAHVDLAVVLRRPLGQHSFIITIIIIIVSYYHSGKENRYIVSLNDVRLKAITATLVSLFTSAVSVMFGANVILSAVLARSGLTSFVLFSNSI